MKPTDHDSYLEQAPDFAKPILARLRALFHRACPEIVETIKWNQPHFEHQGIVGSMAAMKSRVSLGFFKGTLLEDPLKILAPIGKTGMARADFSKQEDMPDDAALLGYIQEALALNREGVQRQKEEKPSEPMPEMPEVFRTALDADEKAQKTYDGFSPSNQREYLEWILEAKREATRDKRVAQAIEWLAEGKPRNWKCMK